MAHIRREFTEFTIEVLNGVLHASTAQAGSPITVTARFSELPADAVDVEFRPGSSIEYAVPARFESAERRDFYANRWLCTWPLFAEVKRRFPDTVGACRLWLDDFPSGAGLAFCGNAASHVLIPDAIFLQSDGYARFREKVRAASRAWALRAEKIFWRGASTGSLDFLRLQRWQDIPRFKLCLLVNGSAAIPQQHLFDVGLSHIVQIQDPKDLEVIEHAGIMRPEVPPLEFLNYRYAIDIDGNSSSWPGLFTKLIMGTTVIKVDSALGYRQWYYDRLLPWKNFVPVSAGMDEMGDVAEWLIAHAGEAAEIAGRGAALADELSLQNVLNESVPRVRALVR